jgi:uncharacterized protein YfdQ (DUF2303 family)
MSLTAEAIQKLAEQALAAAGHDMPKVQGIEHLAVLPAGMNLHNIEAYLPGRIAFRGTLSTSQPEEFAAYVKEHGGMVFIDGNNVSANAIFDLGTVEQPGHCRHQARLSLSKASAYLGLLSINERELSQINLSDWLEDWRDNLIALTPAGEQMHISQAVKAVRTVTIESVTKLNSNVHETGSSRSAFEEIEAKSEVGLPHGFTFTCAPYDGLPHRTFSVRLNVITGGQRPTFKPRIVQLEAHEEAIVNDFKALVSTAVGKKATVIVGTFDPR